MNTVTIVLIVILAVLAIILAVLVFLGKKAEKKQAEQQEAMDAVKQTVSMLIIDKKKMKIKDAGFPDMVLQQTPWYMRSTRVPVIKAKVGPQIMTFIADISVYDIAPLKKEVKATVSGLYITNIKGIRGSIAPAPEKKKSKFAEWRDNLQAKAGAKPLK
ncbi:MAG: hypothetical protein K6A90_05005 [Lachnospiraceae bacterium]|nr:hypothetical protein [Lachnospiraceae bacterium]